MFELSLEKSLGIDDEITDDLCCIVEGLKHV